jgi:glycosyltransferase involved in cell wall biosynthesis
MSQGLAVSVVMPAKNAAATIDAQLDALSRQHIDERWEVVICDNGSSDDTVSIAKSWHDRLPSLRIIDASEARGAGATRNLGVRAARGRIIAFCDADDLVSDGWLAAIAEGMTTHAFAACLWEMSLLNHHRPSGLTQGPTFRMSTLSQFPFAGAGAMAIRRDTFLAIGGFDTRLPIGEDVDLSWRVQLAGTPLVELPDAVVHIRERSGLVATLRQWYAYGRAERQLRVKFAAVPTEHAPLPKEPSRVAQVVGDSVSRKLRKAWRVRGWRDVAPFLQRRARWLGLRWGAIDTTLEPYAGPGAELAEQS